MQPELTHAALTLPPAHRADPEGEDLLRTWAAGKLCLEFRHDADWIATPDVSDYRAWGIVFADAVQHVADALAEAGDPHDETLRQLRRHLDLRLGGHP